MSGGLKMLSGSDMSPSKDNLIISSLEDVHITSDEVNMDISVEINNGGAEHKENYRQTKSANKDKMGSSTGGGILKKDHSTSKSATLPVVADDRNDDTSVTQQKNLINNGSLQHKEQQKKIMMKQQQQQHQQFNPFLVTHPPSLRGSGRGGAEKYHLSKGDDPVAIISHDVIDATSTGTQEGPMVLEVDPVVDELDRRGCCESVSKKINKQICTYFFSSWPFINFS